MVSIKRMKRKKKISTQTSGDWTGTTMSGGKEGHAKGWAELS